MKSLSNQLNVFQIEPISLIILTRNFDTKKSQILPKIISNNNQKQKYTNMFRYNANSFNHNSLKPLLIFIMLSSISLSS